MMIIFYEQDTMLTWYDTWGMVAVFKRKRNGLVYMNIFITKVWYMIEMRQRQWHVNGVEVHCQQRLAWQGQMHKCEIKIFRQLGVNRGTGSVEEIKTEQIDERQH